MKGRMLGMGVAAVSLSVALASVSVAPASAQDAALMRKKGHGYASRTSPRPLTVAKPATPPAPPSPFGLVTAPIGFAGSLATAPLSGLSQAFGYGPIGGPAKPLPIVARYAGAGPVTDSVNQGWDKGVPVSANGPVYKLQPVDNAGGVSPFALIAAPITAATTIAATPFNAAGALVGAPPPPPPVF